MQYRATLVLALLVTGCSRPDQWQSRNRSTPNALAQGIVDEINAVRTSPHIYAKRLDSRRAFYSDTLLSLPGHAPVKTEEGPQALDDAVAALNAATPEAPVEWSAALANVARQVGRATSLGAPDPGATPERGADVREALAFGTSEPDTVVARLLIDDGVKDRRDRALLLDPAMKSAGAACGRHAQYGTMCVIEMSPEARPANR